MRIFDSITELIGNTPLLRVNGYCKRYAAGAEILVKLESMNPAGSVKDRVAAGMIENAEKSGALKPGGTIIEPTSGNTGIGLAAIAAAKGYHVILTMPDTMSIERINILRALGAEVILTKGAEGMSGAVREAEKLAAELENSVITGQFTNPANPEAHRRTTGPEIWRDTEGRVDIFVAAVGTGGTITGTGEYLRSKKPGIGIVAVEPASSPLLSGGQAGPHKIQGIGANFIPQVLNTKLYDEVIGITNEEAFEHSKALAQTEGVLVGISAGAALCAAAKLANRPENAGRCIVVILPDSGDRYYSTPLFLSE